MLDYELDHHVGERGDVGCIAKVIRDGKESELKGVGNGPINAFVHAMKVAGWKDFHAHRLPLPRRSWWLGSGCGGLRAAPQRLGRNRLGCGSRFLHRNGGSEGAGLCLEPSAMIRAQPDQGKAFTKIRGVLSGRLVALQRRVG